MSRTQPTCLKSTSGWVASELRIMEPITKAQMSTNYFSSVFGKVSLFFYITSFFLYTKDTHCGKNSKLLICSKNSVGTYIAIRGHPSYWWINKEINFLLLLAHISCNFLKWSHDQEVAWLYIFDPKKFKNLKIYSVTSIFLRNKLSWILKWVVPEGGSNFENLM